jgi:hypothetical protein
MTSKKPSWSGEHNYLSEAVRADEKITLPSIPGHDDRENRLLELIRQMISKNPADRPSLFKLKIDLMAIRDGATGGTPVPTPPPAPPTDGPTTIGGTPTPPTPKSDLETLGDIIKTLVDQIIAKSATPPPGAPAGGSRLRGTGVSLATAPAATPPDNSAIIASFTALADELKKIAGS